MTVPADNPGDSRFLIRKLFIFPQKDNLSELQRHSRIASRTKSRSCASTYSACGIFGGCHGEIGGTLVGIELDDPRRGTHLAQLIGQVFRKM